MDFMEEWNYNVFFIKIQRNNPNNENLSLQREYKQQYRSMSLLHKISKEDLRNHTKFALQLMAGYQLCLQRPNIAIFRDEEVVLQKTKRIFKRVYYN